MNKITTLFFTALFLCYALTNSTRHEPGFHKESSVVTPHQDVEAVDKSCVIDKGDKIECNMIKILLTTRCTVADSLSHACAMHCEGGVVIVMIIVFAIVDTNGGRMSVGWRRIL
ncbi:hypothetical protein TanjilG_25904 [Lupinus angustifolius]|uniref:Uncharacterized protein n=1 Tax=Lupinus angustifolius TaxID=3871 RepID=A0A1J7GX69_LUPAN|nr:hypothetical protein TanjilG_25904 [Lupinus angustifolius]